MNATAPNRFQHTTLAAFPDKVAGYTLLDEEPGITGVYVRGEDGGLWPARTVCSAQPAHYAEVCAAWLARPGSEDRRSKIVRADKIVPGMIVLTDEGPMFVDESDRWHRWGTTRRIVLAGKETTTTCFCPPETEYRVVPGKHGKHGK